MRSRRRSRSTSVSSPWRFTAPFPVALERGRCDRTRGMSREYAFLRVVYGRSPAGLTRIRADVVIDTVRSAIEYRLERVIAAICTGADAT